MRRTATLLLCAAMLFAAGCGAAKEPNEGNEAGIPSGQVRTGTELTPQEAEEFESLKTASKMVMTTKTGSDLPKTWNYEGEELKAKAANLADLLKEAKSIPGQATSVPMVTMIFDVNSTKKVLNALKDDRFELGGKLYLLNNSAERIYGTFNELKK